MTEQHISGVTVEVTNINWILEFNSSEEKVTLSPEEYSPLQFNNWGESP